jgi:hypothetical protein
MMSYSNRMDMAPSYPLRVYANYEERGHFRHYYEPIGWNPPAYQIAAFHDQGRSISPLPYPPHGDGPAENFHQDASVDPPILLPDAFIPPRHSFAYKPPSQEKFKKASEKNTITKLIATTSFIWELQPSDIVCGRGAPTNYHHGNQSFRSMVKKRQTEYLCSVRRDKPTIAMELLEKVHARGGRFVRRVKTTGSRFAWEEINEKKAYEKVCQALREGAPEIRREMIASVVSCSSRSKENLSPFSCY